MVLRDKCFTDERKRILHTEGKCRGKYNWKYIHVHTHIQRNVNILYMLMDAVFRCLDTSERSHLNYLIKKMMWLTFPNSPKDGTQLILYKEETLVHSNSILRALALNSLSELKRQYREVWFNLD